MSHPQSICDHNLLRLSLDESLSEQQEGSLALHLTECSECREALERMAGEPDRLSRICAALKSEADSSSPDPMARTRVPDFDDEADPAADFAVDFLEPSSDSNAIGRIGDIDVQEIIGSGGMGIVLKGHQPELKRLVAVKVLAPHLAVSGAARKRFAREAQAAAAILHPNVMPILTVHSAGKLPYLVMPFLAAESLQQRINASGSLDVLDVLRIGMQTAQGLAAAHAQGLVHRDIKPANILLEIGVERVMLTDFGLARTIDDASITRTGLIAGTPQYMSPEQVRGEVLDARSDLFSLGSVLYTMATGRPPFRAESTYGILRRITDDTPRSIRELNPQIPDWLVAIIEKLLAKSPADRFGSAGDVAKVLEQCLAHVQQPAVVRLPDFCRQRGSSWRLPMRTFVASGAVVCVVLSALTWSQLPKSLVSSTKNNGSTDTTQASVAPIASDMNWDSAAKELDELDRDALPFETRADLLWDQPPEPNSTKPTSEMPSRLPTELMP